MAFKYQELTPIQSYLGEGKANFRHVLTYDIDLDVHSLETFEQIRQYNSKLTDAFGAGITVASQSGILYMSDDTVQNKVAGVNWEIIKSFPPAFSFRTREQALLAKLLLV